MIESQMLHDNYKLSYLILWAPTPRVKEEIKNIISPFLECSEKIKEQFLPFIPRKENHSNFEGCRCENQ